MDIESQKTSISNTTIEIPSQITTSNNPIPNAASTECIATNISSDKGKGKRDIGSRTASKVWDHFTKLEGDPKFPRTACNYCGKDYACAAKKDGTSNMWTHLKMQCKKYPFRVEDKRQKHLLFEPRKGSSEGDGSGSLKAVFFNTETCRKTLAKMIITDELPFRFVEGEGFRKFCQVMQPKFTVISRTTVARDCLKLFFEEKEKLKRVLKSERICLTTDTWTSIQNINYMCLTAHWIDSEWNLHKRILNFCQIGNHKGETIGKAVESCLLEWGVEKILSVTVDNASSNDNAIKYLKRRTRDWKSIIMENEYLHVRCCAHIVNLIVGDGLKDLNQSIVKIRSAVRYVRSSLSRLSAFKNCVEKLKISNKISLCLDVPTRWNSTYLMLEAAEKYEKAFERLDEDDPRYGSYFVDDENGGKVGPPDQYDWDNARTFVRFLKVFYHVTLRISGSLYVTSNIIFHELISVQSKLSQLCKSGDILLSRMAESMMRKFDKYWGTFENINFLLYVAVVLDPRYKLRYIKFCFNQVYDNAKAKDMTMKVKDTFVKLYEHYLSLDNKLCMETSSSNQSFEELNGDEDEDDLQKILASQFKRHLEAENSVESKSEVERFLMEGSEDPSDSTFDILGWWKLNSPKYRILSLIARDVLAIPVSTVASESAFSTGGRVLDPFRSSLTPLMVEALICCQNWLRSSPIPIDLREAMDDIEKYEDIESEFSSQGNTPIEPTTIED